ncbi:unnamed protein product [Rhizophagus irregularis]|nr:unnamed protein product [Rhizophagus irregularis]
MQAKSSKDSSTFPSLEYFLPDNEYDSDDFDFLGYDLVEKLDEINTEQNEKEKRSKKIILQTDIDKLRNKLHANKYFMEEITLELVCCKCGKEIRLDRKFRDKNLTMHGELSNCKYSNEGQQSIKVFFKPKKIRVEEENIIVKNVACKGLFEDKYREYVLNSPAEFGGSIRPDIAAKELFPEIVKANLRLKSLGKMRCADLKNYLRAHAIWI